MVQQNIFITRFDKNGIIARSFSFAPSTHPTFTSSENSLEYTCILFIRGVLGLFIFFVFFKEGDVQPLQL